MKFRVNIPATQVPAVAGTSIYIFQRGTTTMVPYSVFDAAGNTLANPYSHPGGNIVFHLPVPDAVSVGVKPAGQASPSVAAFIPPVERLYSYAFQKSGAASQWILT